MAEATKGLAAAALLEGPSGDLWRRTVACPPRGRRLGPSMGVATGLRLPQQDRGRRAAALERLRWVHDVFARAEAAASAAAGGHPLCGTQPARRAFVSNERSLLAGAFLRFLPGVPRCDTQCCDLRIIERTRMALVHRARPLHEQRAVGVWCGMPSKRRRGDGARALNIRAWNQILPRLADSHRRVVRSGIGALRLPIGRSRV